MSDFNERKQFYCGQKAKIDKKRVLCCPKFPQGSNDMETLVKTGTFQDVFATKSGAPNDSFLLDPLKRYFNLSGAPLKLRRFILCCAIIFLSVRSF